MDETMNEELQRIRGQKMLKTLRNHHSVPKGQSAVRSASSSNLMSPHRPDAASPPSRQVIRRLSQTIPMTDAEIAANIDPDLADLMDIGSDDSEPQQSAADENAPKMRTTVSEPHPIRFAQRTSGQRVNPMRSGQIGFTPKARPIERSMWAEDEKVPEQTLQRRAQPAVCELRNL